MDPVALLCSVDAVGSLIPSDPRSPNPPRLDELTNHEPDFGGKSPLGSHYVTPPRTQSGFPLHLGRKEGLTRPFSESESNNLKASRACMYRRQLGGRKTHFECSPNFEVTCCE